MPGLAIQLTSQLAGYQLCLMHSKLMESLCLVCADPAPGGYVVPEEGSITFTGNHSLSDNRGGVL